MNRMEQMKRSFKEFLKKTPRKKMEKIIDEIKEDYKNVESPNVEEYFSEIEVDYFSIECVPVNKLPSNKTTIYKAHNSKEYARAV